MWRKFAVGAILVVFALACLERPAVVQGLGGTVSICYGPPTACQRVDTGTPLPVTGTTTSTPTGATTTQVSAAPTATTFSSLLAASSTRKGCLIQNTGATLGYIYFGATGSATTANTFQLPSGASISCATQTGAVATDNVAGTCASSTCAFIIGSQ